MFENLSKKKPKILVIGDLMIDHYLWGEMNRISPEAPVPIVDIKDESITLGGAGNVIKNLTSLNADCTILSVIGTDDDSKSIINEILKLNLGIDNLIIDESRTGSKKSRVIISNQQVLRIDREVKSEISESISDQLINKFTETIKDYDLVLISDYGKGVINEAVSKKIINLSKRLGKKVLVDPKGSNFKKYEGAYLITPNKKEAFQANNIKISDNETLEDSLKSLKNNYNLDVALITLSEDGIAFYESCLEVSSTKAREIYDVTGAGDTVIASLGYCISCGLKINEAVEFANLAAGVVISKVGSSTATFEEISLFQDSIEHKGKVLSEDSLINELKSSDQKKIVFTNGCFDILHRGHVDYLEEARKLGDILVVAVNSDQSIKRIKGDNRPINSESDRASIISKLESVDYVTIFDDDTPEKLIASIRPTILVKGADYKGKEIAGSKYANQVILIDFVEGKSSSNIIEKIKCKN